MIADFPVKFIGFAGRAYAGKSTCAQLAADIIGGVLVLPIAYHLKLWARQVGWDGKKDDRGRALLQTIGQAARDYDPDIWFDLWLEAARWRARVDGLPRLVVIADDIRHDNEAAAILGMGGVVVEVIRQGGPTLGGGFELHPSEAGLCPQVSSKCPVIKNDGGLPDLRAKVGQLVEKMSQGIDLGGLVL
jgi:hypothetical protein